MPVLPSRFMAQSMSVLLSSNYVSFKTVVTILIIDSLSLFVTIEQNDSFSILVNINNFDFSN